MVETAAVFVLYSFGPLALICACLAAIGLIEEANNWWKYRR